MGEQEEQRGKLASVGSDNTSRRQDIRERVLEATRERGEDERRLPARVVAEQWERLWASSSWEKGIIIGGTALAIVAAVIALVAIMGNGGDQPTASAQRGPLAALATSTPESTDEAAPTRTAAPTFTPLRPRRTPAGAAPSTTPESSLNREDCQEISGTPYLSPDEREWYLGNCAGTEEPGETATPPRQPGPGPDGGNPPVYPTSPPPPPPAPTPDTGLSASEAISLAVSWMTAQTQGTYTINASTCNATQMGVRWIVICQGYQQGCQGDACGTTLSACVFDDPRYVAPADRC